MLGRAIESLSKVGQLRMAERLKEKDLFSSFQLYFLIDILSAKCGMKCGIMKKRKRNV